MLPLARRASFNPRKAPVYLKCKVKCVHYSHGFPTRMLRLKYNISPLIPAIPPVQKKLDKQPWRMTTVPASGPPTLALSGAVGNIIPDEHLPRNDRRLFSLLFDFCTVLIKIAFCHLKVTTKRSKRNSLLYGQRFSQDKLIIYMIIFFLFIFTNHNPNGGLLIDLLLLF